MKSMMRSAVSVLLFALAAPAAMAVDCEAGYAAFEKTVYQKVRRSCALCHDGSKSQAPPFATEDARASYNHLVRYVNFGTVDDSLLVIRAGNNHCGKENCQAPSGQEMSKLVGEWIEGGEKTCERNGHLFSDAVPMPGSLPDKDVGFSEVSIDLGMIKPELKGASLLLEVQNYMDRSSVTKGAYRVKSPRIVGVKSAVHVKDMKILLNGMYDVVYGQYSPIDRVFPSYTLPDASTTTPVLSASTIIIIKDGLANPKLSVSFSDISTRDQDAACMNAADFSTKVEPMLKASNCTSCHNGKGDTLSERALDLSLPSSKVCGQVSALVDPKYFMVSPLLMIPSQGLNNHPQLSDEQRTAYVAAIRSWAKK